MASKTEIIEYVIRHGERRAILCAAVNDSGTYSVTFAMCHRNDKFDRVRGLEICRNRAAAWAERCRKNLDKAKNENSAACDPIDFCMRFPHTIESEMMKFLDRCSRFFKGRGQAYPLLPQDKRYRNPNRPDPIQRWHFESIY